MEIFKLWPKNLSGRRIAKMLTVMKLTTLLVLIFSMQVTAKVHSQEKVTLSVKNASLVFVLKEIHKQTGYLYSIMDDYNDRSVKINLSITNAPLEEVLNLVFKNQPFSYTIIEKTIVVKQKEEKKLPFIVPSDPPEIVGIVTSEDGTPLLGATVLIKGINKTGTTNAKGEFVFQVVAGTYEVEVSFVGYEKTTAHVNVVGQVGRFEVALKQSMNNLDETVIKGYYNTTKRLNTGNVTTIRSEVIQEQPVSNVLGALEGRVPGLYVQQQNGLPGGNYGVQLRGQNSIAGGNNPLYIVDGVPYGGVISSSNNNFGSGMATPLVNSGNPFDYINPSDIESISILKDADATAIYGSRGANGVILITTKKGQAGTTRVDINARAGEGKISHFLNLLNTQQYLQMRHEAFKNDGVSPGSADYDINGAWDTTRYTNWQKSLLGGTAHFTDLQGTISGGNSNTQFLIGTSYHKETTVFLGSDMDQKAAVNLSLSHISGDQKFKTNISLAYLLDNNNLPGADLTGYATTYLVPDAPALYNADGTLNWKNSTWTNPLSYLRQRYTSNTHNLISNLQLSYTLLQGLQVKASFGYTNMVFNELVTTPLSSFDPALTNSKSSAQYGNTNFNSWIIEPQAEYERKIGKSKINFLVGSSFQESTQKIQRFTGTGYANDALLQNIASASAISQVSSNYIQYRYNGIYARMNYNLNDKYLINLTARKDGSSRFGPGNQFGNFGAAGLAWIFSKEPLIQRNLPFLSFGKIRSSYGITGNDQIGDYKYLRTYSSNSTVYQGVSGLIPTGLYNADFGWEINKKFEIALDLGLFHDRILLSGDYYQNKSSNQLVGYPLAPTTGFTSVTANFPATVQNTGIELELSTVNIKSKDFNWSTSFNLTIPRNKLANFPNLAASGSYANSLIVGQPLSIRRKFIVAGVNSTTGQYQFVDAKNSLTYSPAYPTDLITKVNVGQNYYGGLLNNFQYKSFKLDIFFQFVKQMGANSFYFYGTPGFMTNQPADVMGRWQKPGDKTTIQQFTQAYGNTYLSYSSLSNYGNTAFGEASFIRLKNVSLSYQLPLAAKNKIHAQNFKIYLQAQNLFTITKFSLLDPETPSSITLPPLRIITAGIQIII